jgi:hypothetical protein
MPTLQVFNTTGGVKKGVRMQVLKGGTNSLYGMNWLVKGVIGSAKG